ncbi:MAG: AMP-binding protein [Planctomycetes bacterium]|nr:AMP-binding protein [Planctomycetota bacterium]
MVEKILREIPDVRQVYLLIRPKTRPSGEVVSASDRLQKELIGSDVFNRLRRERADFDAFVGRKLTAVPGDVSMEGMDMPPETYERLVQDVEVIINSAAVVVFDERLDYAVQLNTEGPRRLLEFARSCQRLAVFVHVSTAYVNGQRVGRVPEKLFDPGCSIAYELHNGQAPAFSIEREIELALERGREVEEQARQPEMFERFHRAALRELGPGYLPGSNKVKAQTEAERNKYIRTRLVKDGLERARLHGWHDTYTFTKAMGEQILVRDRGNIPIAIVRPSIIESARCEPEPGWIDGFRMADPLIAAFGKGRLKDFPANPECVLDIVPVDCVVNAILAAVPCTADRGGIQVYQVATGTLNPVRLREVVDLIFEYFTRNPMRDRQGGPIRVSSWTYPTRKVFERRNRFRYHLPLAVAEWATRWIPGLGRYRTRASIARTSVERINYYAELYGPYVEYGCQFGTENTCRMLQDLVEEERDRFDFDVRRIDWRQYLCDIHIPGLKRHVLKIETVDEEETPDRHSDARKTEEDPEKELQAGIRTIQELYIQSAVRFGNKTALQIKRNDRWMRFSYQQVRELARQYRTSLARAGLRRGDRLLLVSENQPEWGIGYLGAISLGVTVVPLDRQTRAEEVLKVAEFVEARFLLASPAAHAALRGQAGDRLDALRVLNLNNYALAASAADSAQPPHPQAEIVPPVEVGPEDIASIIFTSGTTVDPKGVMLSHSNFISNVVAVAEVLAPYETDQFLSVLPLHHAFEFTGGFLMPLFGGATITYVNALKSKVILEAMQETGTTCLLGVPRLFKVFHDGIAGEIEKMGALTSGVVGALKTVSQASHAVTGVNSGRRLFSRVHETFGGRIRVFVSGGAALDPRLFEDFQRMGFPLCEGYGLTETAPVLTVNPLEKPKKGSVGPPVPNIELRLDNPDPSGVGEIVVRGPSIMKGYYRNEAATHKVLQDGWLHTGDLGRQDEEGYVTITGRVKDLIVTAAGKNVYPDEVETLYRDLPGVKEMCVIGMRSDDDFGEEVHLVVVLDPSRPAERAREEVHGHIKKISRDLPTYQRIQKVHFWTQDLPKTPTLKVRRSQVRQKLLEEQSPTVPASAPSASAAVSGGDWEQDFFHFLSDLTGVPVPEITSESDLQFDLMMDSITKIEFLLMTEGRYGVRLPETLAPRLHLVQDALNVVRLELEKQRGRAEPESGEPRSDTVDWSHILKAGALAPEDVEAIQQGRGVQAMARRAFQKGLGVACRAYFPIRASGLDLLPRSGPFLIAANHSSHLDSAALLSVLQDLSPRLRILGARDYFFNRPLKGWFFRNFLNVLPFDRQENFLQGLRIARACIEKDLALLIFPEGTRSLSGDIQPFKVGLGIIAYELDVPVVPVRIRGTYQALPKGRALPRRRPISVTFGAPILMSEFQPATDQPPRFPVYKRVVDAVRERILQL